MRRSLVIPALAAACLFGVTASTDDTVSTAKDVKVKVEALATSLKMNLPATVAAQPTSSK